MSRFLIACAVVCFAGHARAEGVAVTVVYETVKADEPSGEKIDIKNVSAAVEKRVAASGGQQVETHVEDQQKIVVTFRADDSKSIDRVKQCLGRTGNLEFHIVADKASGDFDDLIEAAKKKIDALDKKDVRDAKGKIVGKWARAGQPAPIPSSWFTRKNHDGKDEILLALDENDVTSKDLTSVAAVTGPTGRAVSFHLNAEGAKRFGKLTENNLPRENGVRYYLAIVIDDEVINAPSIQGKITDSGELSGNFSEAEVRDLVSVLGSGPLPAKLRLVKELHPDAK